MHLLKVAVLDRHRFLHQRRSCEPQKEGVETFLSDRYSLLEKGLVRRAFCPLKTGEARIQQLQYHMYRPLDDLLSGIDYKRDRDGHISTSSVCSPD